MIDVKLATQEIVPVVSCWHRLIQPRLELVKRVRKMSETSTRRDPQERVASGIASDDEVDTLISVRYLLRRCVLSHRRRFNFELSLRLYRRIHSRWLFLPHS